jgi:hypothetical protein
MPCMFARVIDEPGDGEERMLLYRNEEHLEVVPESIRQVPRGTLVFLWGHPGDWSRGSTLVGGATWPPDLPGPEVLRENLDRVAHPMDLRTSTDGQWALDPRGFPCELGRIRLARGRTGRLVSWAGWRLSQLYGSPVVLHRAVVEEQEVWILPPGAVPRPPVDRYPEPAGSVGDGNDIGGASRNVGGVGGRLLDARVPLDELTLCDGEVAAELKGIGRVVAKAPTSKAVFDPLKRELAEITRCKVRIYGYLYAGGASALQATGLDGLSDVFRRAQVKQFVRQSEVSPGVVDVGRLRATLGGGGSGEDIWDIEELGLQKRREALRRVFGLWNERDDVLLFQEVGMLVPVDAADRGPPWLVWEMLAKNRATYLFKPSAEQRAQLLAWLTDPDRRWLDIIQQRSLRDELGFVKRVLHSDGDQVLERWWRDLCGVLAG